MKIALSAGHNHYAGGVFDNGTSGHGRVEAVDAKKVVKKVERGLKVKGHDVIDVTPYNQYFSSQKAAHVERANRVKKHNPDLYLDIHLNSGGGTGPETIVYSTHSSAYAWARKITNSIAAKTGLTNQRGVKVRPQYWSVHLQPQPSIIVEGGFMDTKKDMDALTVEKYAQAIIDVFPDLNPKPQNHWGEKAYQELNRKGIKIHDKRFDDNITRAEVFALLNQIVK